MDYGTGAIFGCPAHDQRDLDFARKYDLPVTPVVLPPESDADMFAIGTEAYTGPGTIFNSDFLNGLSVEDATSKVANRLEYLRALEAERKRYMKEQSGGQEVVEEEIVDSSSSDEDEELNLLDFKKLKQYLPKKSANNIIRENL